MKLKRWLAFQIIVVLIIASAQGKAHANYYIDGDVLLDRCTSKLVGNGIADYSFCAGYLVSIADSLDRVGVTISYSNGGNIYIRACIPGGSVTQMQLIDIVVRFLRASPELRHFNGSMLATRAISQAFPCQ